MLNRGKNVIGAFFFQITFILSKSGNGGVSRFLAKKHRTLMMFFVGK